MKLRVLSLLTIFSLPLFIWINNVNAVDVTNPPVPAIYAPVFVSGFQISNQLDAIELYNESDTPVDLSNWSIKYKSIYADQICEIKFDDWILPESYVVAVGDSGPLASLSSNSNVMTYPSCLRSTSDGFSFSLNDGGNNTETVIPNLTTSPSAYVRKGLTKTYRSGKFSTDFISINRSLYAGQWYQPIQSTQLQFSEILVNSRNCSPLESALDCSDYVKIYNPTNRPIDLSWFRLRNGYMGQTPSSSNTTELEGSIDPGHYSTISTGVTDGGGWLWLEDAYGIKRYDNTVQDYPDGSSDTKIGQSWAYDSIDGIWKWTTKPTPDDAPSVFPILIPEIKVTVDDSLTPCRVGQYRSLETNRCRNIVSDLNVLLPCEEGKERNPVTNRCRSVSVDAGSLTPCKEGQERNPETNRCRNIVSSIKKADFAPENNSQSSDAGLIWSVLIVCTLGIGYAVWEWRNELSNLLKIVSSVFHKTNK